MQLRIASPARIADIAGTHEPGDVIDNPSAALLDLAQRAKDGDRSAFNPETGTPFCEFVQPAPARLVKPADAAPTESEEKV